ncbi:hypothetical protein DVJ83_18030 (plasmid) [Deinococcus wulumuqiensis]|uniref:Uncharacterized protein n=1 Tax=Deinococcus wulumuqiensis TaxID=980427 RepID=A0A345IMS4_9DEIO|nr:hypothetical protein [Deinococcus wulumuqiensis]AXH00997.1 hypothetical protein DVJ83_18030 [Deinococcus wulumuqiensis]
MNGHLLSLMRGNTTLAEIITPGHTVAESANALAALLNLNQSTGHELVLHCEAGTRVQAGDLIFDGMRVYQVQLTQPGSTGLVTLDRAP